MKKLMIASDIHGSTYYCQMMLDRFHEERADRLLLLGDLLYHGPRNALPEEYAPAQVAEMLNRMRERLLCVHGNCDAEVCQMVLNVPILAEYAVFPLETGCLYATHGHHFNEQTPPPLVAGDILLCGHTHVPACIVCDSFTYLNPGSVSIPKENSPHSYMILENGVFSWKELDTGKEYRRWSIH